MEYIYAYSKKSRKKLSTQVNVQYRANFLDLIISTAARQEGSLKNFLLLGDNHHNLFGNLHLYLFSTNFVINT